MAESVGASALGHSAPPDADPVELVVIAVPDISATGHIAEAIKLLVESGSIRILDIVVVETELGGGFSWVEFEDVAGLAPLRDVEGEVGRWLSTDDIALTCSALAAGSTALLLVVEDRWALPLAEAALACGGRIVGGERIPGGRKVHRRMEET